jgi:hypothetical protein
MSEHPNVAALLGRVFERSDDRRTADRTGGTTWQ